MSKNGRGAKKLFRIYGKAYVCYKIFGESKFVFRYINDSQVMEFLIADTKLASIGLSKVIMK